LQVIASTVYFDTTILQLTNYGFTEEISFRENKNYRFKQKPKFSASLYRVGHAEAQRKPLSLFNKYDVIILFKLYNEYVEYNTNLDFRFLSRKF